MLIVRRIGSGFLAFMAVVVWFAMAPEEHAVSSTSSHDRSITQALEEFELNNQNAQGAPQQQVVNGWVARDLLSVVAAQQNDLIAASASQTPDPRVPALLMLGLFGLALLGGTTPATGSFAPAASAAVPSSTRPDVDLSSQGESSSAMSAESAIAVTEGGQAGTQGGSSGDRVS